MQSIKIIGLGVASFLLFIPVIQTINIDTRIGHAQATQSYVYPTQQPFNNNDATYGKVEFAEGIVLYPSAGVGYVCNATLGVEPPISGSIRLSTPVAGSSYNIFTAHDLILSCTVFDLGAFPSEGSGFFYINYPNQIFLTRDMSAPSNFGLLYFVS